MTQMNELELADVPRTQPSTRFCKDCRHAITEELGSKLSTGRWMCRKTMTISKVDGTPKYRTCVMVRLDLDDQSARISQRAPLTCGESGAWFEPWPDKGRDE